MNETPRIFCGATYYSPDKEILKEWIFKHFEGWFGKNHMIRGRDFLYIGFWTKVGATYYASIFSSRGQ